MKKRHLLKIGIIIFFIIISIFYYKNKKNVNNISKSILDKDKNILNISSYKANVTVEVYSNKNTNRYNLMQMYINPNMFKQEVIEPTNIKGLTILYVDNNLEIKNSILSLSKIYNNYKFLENNSLSLIDFIEYNEKNIIEKQETEDDVLLKLETENRYSKYKILTIDKNKLIPKKLEIQDNNKNTKVYILYNDITINNTTKEDIM